MIYDRWSFNNNFEVLFADVYFSALFCIFLTAEHSIAKEKFYIAVPRNAYRFPCQLLSICPVK